MSFLIAVYVNEGIVLASDRRTTYSNKKTLGEITINQIGIHMTDSTDKTFLCPNGVGISTCGEASLQGKPITGFIQDMIRTQIRKDCSIENVPQIIIDCFSRLPKIPDASFIVAGYQESESLKEQKIYKVRVQTGKIEPIDTSNQGATWDGEITTLARLVRNVGIKKDDGGYLDLPAEEILWSYFTLQDAVDFARYAVETTIKTMRFKNVIETVGGKVDILVITPEGANWLQKEKLD